MKTAIIAFGVGYEYEAMKYFIHSCHVYAPSTDVIIFAGDNIHELREAACDYPRVRFIRFRERLPAKVIGKAVMWWPRLARTYARIIGGLGSRSQTRAILNDLASPLTQFMVKRFFRLERLMGEIRHDYIMITDLRDVVLQGNPFEGLSENAIMTGVEPVTVGESEMNAGWIRHTYGEATLGRLKPRAVACAGVTIGSRKAIRQYIHEQVTETHKTLPRIIGMLGADQAIHIRLFYEGLKNLDILMEQNGTGKIATLHFSTLKEFQTENGHVSNRNGKALPVIHQYDRHPKLASAIRARLTGGVVLANVA